MGGYEEDLAHIHDRGFGDYARSAAPGILARLRAQGPPGRSPVLDLGCGSGILSEALSREGYRVIGVDPSSAMIALARERVPAARFALGTVHSLEVPPCRAVTAVGEVVNYRSAADPPDASFEALALRVHDVLEAGGLFLFDAFEAPAPGQAPPGGRNHYLADDWAVLIDATFDPGSRRLRRAISTFRKVGDTYRRADEVHELALYRRNEIRAILEELGFEVEMGAGYGAVPLPPGRLAVVARRRI